jgi:hypothetical protein
MVSSIFDRVTLRGVAKNYRRGHPHYVLGLDLGQANDYTALAVTERVVKPVGAPYTHPRGSDYERRQNVENHYHVRHLGRPPLRTPYTEVVDGVVARIKALLPHDKYPGGGYASLVVDSTGVGRGVVDMLYSELNKFGKGDPHVGLIPATITGSQGRATSSNGFVSLPKHELIFTGGVIPLQSGRLKWGPGIRDRRALEEELMNYRKRINLNASVQFEPWRENDHDDLLFALCLAGWFWGKRNLQYLVLDDFEGLTPPQPAGRSPITGSPLPPLP